MTSEPCPSILPVVGIPLRLMSYGGSAMIKTLIGLLVNVALWRRAKLQIVKAP